VYVGNYAFYGCSSLEQVDMPEVSSIDYYAFQNCVSLTAADFPKL